jgi:hypothetical protein
MSANLPSIGLLAFDSLRAEDEPWLNQCYVPPPDFELIAGARSALVFGAPGTGKTALFRALQERLVPADDQQKSVSSLTVNWRPTPVAPQIPGSTAARLQLLQVFDDCAETLLAHLARCPDRFSIAPSDVQDTLVWFINHYLGPDTSQRVNAYATRSQGAGKTLLNSLPSFPPSLQ